MPAWVWAPGDEPERWAVMGLGRDAISGDISCGIACEQHADDNIVLQLLLTLDVSGPTATWKAQEGYGELSDVPGWFWRHLWAQVVSL